jgi:hypothetical protein
MQVERPEESTADVQRKSLKNYIAKLKERYPVKPSTGE